MNEITLLFIYENENRWKPWGIKNGVAHKPESAGDIIDRMMCTAQDTWVQLSTEDYGLPFIKSDAYVCF